MCKCVRKKRSNQLNWEPYRYPCSKLDDMSNQMGVRINKLSSKYLSKHVRVNKIEIRYACIDKTTKRENAEKKTKERDYSVSIFNMHDENRGGVEKHEV